MFARRRCTNLLPVVLLIVGFLLSFILMKKMKDLYDSNQKLHRIKNYKIYMEEISDLLKVVSQSANKSTLELHRLNTALGQGLDHKPTRSPEVTNL